MATQSNRFGRRLDRAQSEMGKYRDAAVAAYNNRLAQEAAAEQAKRDGLVSRARTKAAPLWTDSTGKILLGDVTKETRVEEIDEDAGLVILSVMDANTAGVVEVTFAVYPDKNEPTVIVNNVDGAWNQGPVVKDLDDVGERIVKGGV